MLRLLSAGFRLPAALARAVGGLVAPTHDPPRPRTREMELEAQIVRLKAERDALERKIGVRPRQRRWL